MDIVVGTSNKGKLKEIKEIMKDTEYKVFSLDDLNINVNIEEDGQTYEENALKKAKEICKLTNKIVLADDSGLEIDFLDKKPGIYSSRFLGEDTPYNIKNRKILEMLKDVDWNKRTARFVCCIACYFPSGDSFCVKDTLEGYISLEGGTIKITAGQDGIQAETNLLITDGNIDKNLAQISKEEKSKISHRYKALLKMKDKLKSYKFI